MKALQSEVLRQIQRQKERRQNETSTQSPESGPAGCGSRPLERRVHPGRRVENMMVSTQGGNTENKPLYGANSVY
jgi:hypothetical protein